jgi:hypothetical protein
MDRAETEGGPRPADCGFVVVVLVEVPEVEAALAGGLVSTENAPTFLQYRQELRLSEISGAGIRRNGRPPTRAR